MMALKHPAQVDAIACGIDEGVAHRLRRDLECRSSTSAAPPAANISNSFDSSEDVAVSQAQHQPVIPRAKPRGCVGRPLYDGR
jgi:hypothetical protein